MWAFTLYALRYLYITLHVHLQLESIRDVPAVRLLVQFLLREIQVMCSEIISEEETTLQLAGKHGKTASEMSC